jgi:hypothetical protein
MGLIDRFTALFRRQGPAQEKTTSDELARPSRPTAMLDRFGVERSRREIVEVCRQMYDEDPRAAGVLETLARDAVMGGFQVQVEEGADAERAQEVADELIERLGLFKRLDDWARLSFRDGDSFLELSVDREGLIVDVTRKPTLEMHRNSNDQDRFEDPARAFWWADKLWIGQEAPQDAVWFAEWQMIHARWGHDEGSRYGRPLFAAARGPWKRIKEGEFDISVRRKTRAGMKFLHVIEGASPADLEAYKTNNKDALDNPFSAIADFFTNKPGAIQAVQGDARLSEIDDVVHHIRTWWVKSPVPMSLVGYGQDLNRDVLEEQKLQYDRALESVTEWVEDQLVTPLLERQWLLQGMWPKGMSYNLTWAVKQALTAEILKTLAEALVRLQATGLFDDETLLRLAARIVPGLDMEMLLGALRQARASRPDEIGRIATGATALGGL